MIDFIESPLVSSVLGAVPVGVLFMKGRGRLALGVFALSVFGLAIHVAVGTAVGLFALALALRLGRPGSWWAKRFYDRRALKRAQARHTQPRHPRLQAVVGAAWLALTALTTAWATLDAALAG